MLLSKFLQNTDLCQHTDLIKQNLHSNSISTKISQSSSIRQSPSTILVRSDSDRNTSLLISSLMRSATIQQKLIFVSTSKPFEHWQRILKKQNFDLTKSINQSHLTYIDCNGESNDDRFGSPLFSSNFCQNLNQLYDKIIEASLSNSSAAYTIIFDDLKLLIDLYQQPNDSSIFLDFQMSLEEYFFKNYQKASSIQSFVDSRFQPSLNLKSLQNNSNFIAKICEYFESNLIDILIDSIDLYSFSGNTCSSEVDGKMKIHKNNDLTEFYNKASHQSQLSEQEYFHNLIASHKSNSDDLIIHFKILENGSDARIFIPGSNTAFLA